MHTLNNDTIHQGCLETHIAPPECAESEVRLIEISERDRERRRCGEHHFTKLALRNSARSQKLHESEKSEKLEETVYASASMNG